MATKTMAIIGVGPSIGMALARKFGREGYRIGLISRTQEKLDGYVSELSSLGIESVGFAADVHDRGALESAIQKVVARLGSIDILEYSPLMDMASLVSVLNLTVDTVQRDISFQILGAITAVNAVVQGMIKKGSGALLFTLGASAYSSCPSHSNGSIGVVAAKQYALMLSTALKPKGIYVGTLAIGKPFQPDEIADIYWDKVQKRSSVETLYGDPRIQAAWEIVLGLGLGITYPPSLIEGPFPKPNDEYERNLYLVGISHSANCGIFFGKKPDGDYIKRHRELARSIGGNPDALNYGGDIDKVFPVITTV